MKSLSILGFVLLVSAYLANQRSRLRADSPIYLATNAFGAFLLAVYSLYIQEWVFVALEGFWSAASVFALAKARRP